MSLYVSLLLHSRNVCQSNFPHSLPKLLQSVAWNNRTDVAQVSIFCSFDMHTKCYCICTLVVYWLLCFPSVAHCLITKYRQRNYLDDVVSVDRCPPSTSFPRDPSIPFSRTIDFRVDCPTRTLHFLSWSILVQK